MLNDNNSRGCEKKCLAIIVRHGRKYASTSFRCSFVKHRLMSIARQVFRGLTFDGMNAKTVLVQPVDLTFSKIADLISISSHYMMCVLQTSS